MKEEHKKRLCELAGETFYIDKDIGWDKLKLSLRTLIKAMWAINRESFEDSVYMRPEMEMNADCVKVYSHEDIETFLFDDAAKNDNHEQKALESALIYILDKEEK